MSDWRTDEMSVEQRAKAVIVTIWAGPDPGSSGSLSDLLTTFGHACAAAAERERDEAREKCQHSCASVIEELRDERNEICSLLGEPTPATKWHTMKALSELIAERDALRAALREARLAVDAIEQLALGCRQYSGPWNNVIEKSRDSGDAITDAIAAAEGKG